MAPIKVQKNSLSLFSGFIWFIYQLPFRLIHYIIWRVNQMFVIKLCYAIISALRIFHPKVLYSHIIIILKYIHPKVMLKRILQPLGNSWMKVVNVHTNIKAVVKALLKKFLSIANPIIFVYFIMIFCKKINPLQRLGMIFPNRSMTGIFKQMVFIKYLKEIVSSTLLKARNIKLQMITFMIFWMKHMILKTLIQFSAILAQQIYLEKLFSSLISTLGHVYKKLMPQLIMFLLKGSIIKKIFHKKVLNFMISVFKVHQQILLDLTFIGAKNLAKKDHVKALSKNVYQCMKATSVQVYQETKHLSANVYTTSYPLVIIATQKLYRDKVFFLLCLYYMNFGVMVVQ